MKETAERNRAHTHKLRQVGELERLRVMIVDVLLDLLDTTAFSSAFRMGKSAGSQHSGAVRNRKFIQDIQRLEELDETLRLIRDGIKRRIDLHYR